MQLGQEKEAGEGTTVIMVQVLLHRKELPHPLLKLIS